MPTQRLEDAFLDLLDAPATPSVPQAEVAIMIALVRTEFTKAAQRTRSLVIIVLLVGLPTLIVVAIHARGTGSTAATTAKDCSCWPAKAVCSSPPPSSAS